MKKIVVAGCGTDVGKTVVSSILVTALDGDYWKPIQCGNLEKSDANRVQEWVPKMKGIIHPSSYSLKAAVSPHHAAQLENRTIDLIQIIPPEGTRTLIIESAGGVLVPLNDKELTIDLFQTWDAYWILVSKHYLGSINHTLLTVEALKNRGINLHSILFNGAPNRYTEEAILTYSKVLCLGRLFQEKSINHKIIQRYAKQWKKILCKHLK